MNYEGETTVRESVLRAWQARSGPRWSTRTGRWRRDAARRHDGLGRCLRLAAGLGAGLGLLVVCLVVAAVVLPPLFMVVPVFAALVALAVAVNLGVGDSAEAAPGEVGRAPALLQLTRASRFSNGSRRCSRMIVRAEAGQTAQIRGGWS
jgi:hypothetical protein